MDSSGFNAGFVAGIRASRDNNPALDLLIGVIDDLMSNYSPPPPPYEDLERREAWMLLWRSGVRGARDLDKASLQAVQLSREMDQKKPGPDSGSIPQHP